MLMLEILTIFGIAWGITGFIWSEHFYYRIKREVLDPWKDAVFSHDWFMCDVYQTTADMMLQDYHPSIAHLSPVHWMETWNKQYMPDVITVRK